MTSIESKDFIAASFYVFKHKDADIKCNVWTYSAERRYACKVNIEEELFSCDVITGVRVIWTYYNPHTLCQLRIELYSDIYRFILYHKWGKSPIKKIYFKIQKIHFLIKLMFPTIHLYHPSWLCLRNPYFGKSTFQICQNCWGTFNFFECMQPQQWQCLAHNTLACSKYDTFCTPLDVDHCSLINYCKITQYCVVHDLVWVTWVTLLHKT